MGEGGTKATQADMSQGFTRSEHDFALTASVFVKYAKVEGLDFLSLDPADMHKSKIRTCSSELAPPSPG